MPQSAVGLDLERIGELGVSLLVVDERTERTLHPILERDKERVACHGIGAWCLISTPSSGGLKVRVTSPSISSFQNSGRRSAGAPENGSHRQIGKMTSM